MSDPRPLQEIGGSALLLLEADADGSASARWAWREAGLTVRVVRGRKMRTTDRLFDEFAAALQFPPYFGENWDAFDECLSDMDWLSAGNGIAIAIVEPGDVLGSEAETALIMLVRMIVSAAQTYSQPIALGEWWDRPAVPFHVVLLASPGDAAAVRARWEAAGAQVASLP